MCVCVCVYVLRVDYLVKWHSKLFRLFTAKFCLYI